MNGKQLLSMKCVLCVQQTLNYFTRFCTSTIKIVPVQTILYQFNIFCTSSKTNCTKVQIELQHIYVIHRLGGPYREKLCPRLHAEGRTQDRGHVFIFSAIFL